MRRLATLVAACAPIALGAFSSLTPSAGAAARKISFTAIVTHFTVEVGLTPSEKFAERLLNTKGKTVGSATLNCTNTATQQTCSATYTLKKLLPKGTIGASLTFPKGGTGKGQLTEGTGAFAGAKGTITVKHVDTKNTKYTVTVKLR